MKDLPRLTDAEWTVMNAVWQGSPCSARDVMERAAAEGWAYTTVKTLLDRLVEKKVLGVRLRANTSLYEPRLERAQAQRSAVRSLLAKAFDGTFGALLQHLVADGKLSTKERAELQQLLAEAEREARKS